MNFSFFINQLNKENITFVLSLIGSFYAFFNVINSWLKSRERYSVDIFKTRISSNESILIYLSITNRSANNLIINSFSLVTDNKNSNEVLNCSLIPENVFTYTKQVNRIEVFRKEDFSFKLPLTIPPRSAVSGYAYFPNDIYSSEVLKKFQILRIHTSRRHARQTKLSDIQYL